jgi:hypothetical protein
MKGIQQEETEIDVELLLCFLGCLLFTFKNDWKVIFPFENK